MVESFFGSEIKTTTGLFGVGKALIVFFLVSNLIGSAEAGNLYQSIMTEDLSAPLMLDEVNTTQDEVIFIVTINIAGAIPTEPSVLWHGDKVIAKPDHKRKEAQTRQRFCVLRIITLNGDEVVPKQKSKNCLGSISERDGTAGLRLLKGGNVSMFSLFVPSMDIIRQATVTDGLSD